MKKLHTTATAFLLTTALLLSGCAEQSNTLAPGADTSSENSSSSSDSSTSAAPESSVSSESQTTESGNSSSTDSGNSESSSDSSSNITNPNAVPVEFTDEDRELQKILEELNDGLMTVGGWLMASYPHLDNIKIIDGEYYMSDSSKAEQILLDYRFLFPDDESGQYSRYFLIPDNYEEHGVILPNTYDGMRNFMLAFLTEECTDYMMSYCCDKGSMTENSDGSYTVTLDGKYIGAVGYCKFIEIDEKMYRFDSAGNRSLMDTHCQSAKVISKTDDTIIFSYLSGYGYSYRPDAYREEYGDVSLYEENAIIGVLKYERGGWRRDTDRDWMKYWD